MTQTSLNSFCIESHNRTAYHWIVNSALCLSTTEAMALLESYVHEALQVLGKLYKNYVVMYQTNKSSSWHGEQRTYFLIF